MVPTPAEVTGMRSSIREMSCCEAGSPLRKHGGRWVTTTSSLRVLRGFQRCAKPVRPSGPARKWSARSMSSLLPSLSEGGFGRSLTDVPVARLSTPVVPLTPLREGVLELDHLILHWGGRLDDVRVAWRVTGNAHGPLVAALGGISAGRVVADIGTREKGWWGEVIGEGKALDTERYQVLGLDFLGGSGATTGPRPGQTNFPSISTYDQAEIL